MKRFATAVLAGITTVGLSTVGLGSAVATEKGDEPKDDYPKVGKWEYYDEKFTIPRGDACKDKIKVHEKGALRVTEYSEKKSLIEFKDWSYGKLHNPKTHRSIKVGNGGDLHEKRVSDDRIRGTMKGEKYAFGSGVYGIVYVRGVAKYTVTELGTPDEALNIKSVKGKYVELCKKLGTKPVHGSNPAA
jgi:hypothetical protein